MTESTKSFLTSGEIDKHIRFLDKYSREHGIIFRVSRTGVTVEVLPK